MSARKKRTTQRETRASNDDLAERLSKLSEQELLAWADDLWAHASIEELDALVERALSTTHKGRR